jgi:hypothetical protein
LTEKLNYGFTEDPCGLYHPSGEGLFELPAMLDSEWHQVNSLKSVGMTVDLSKSMNRTASFLDVVLSKEIQYLMFNAEKHLLPLLPLEIAESHRK